jgi:hypothetical protein
MKIGQKKDYAMNKGISEDEFYELFIARPYYFRNKR